jgi:hypothetical protein
MNQIVDDPLTETPMYVESDYIASTLTVTPTPTPSPTPGVYVSWIMNNKTLVAIFALMILFFFMMIRIKFPREMIFNYFMRVVNTLQPTKYY